MHLAQGRVGDGDCAHDVVRVAVHQDDVATLDGDVGTCADP